MLGYRKGVHVWRGIPVLSHIKPGQRKIKVYLPKGASWVHVQEGLLTRVVNL